MPFDLHLRSISTSSLIFIFFRIKVVLRVQNFFHAQSLALESLLHDLLVFFHADPHLVANFHVFHELVNFFLRTKSNHNEFQVVSADLFFIVCIFIENFIEKVVDFFLLFQLLLMDLVCLCGGVFNQNISGIHLDLIIEGTFFDGLAIRGPCGTERSQSYDSHGKTALFRS